jgi:CheY-like chemotaxis protein
VKILIVDDEEMILALTRKILERVGHEVLLASSGPQALELPYGGDSPIDLAVIDLSMTGMTGFETLRRLRAVLPELPAVISSGHLSEALDIPEDIRANTWTLQKPFKASDLTETLDEILSSRQHS